MSCAPHRLCYIPLVKYPNALIAYTVHHSPNNVEYVSRITQFKLV